mgnify:CR=1 FL=1
MVLITVSIPVNGHKRTENVSVELAYRRIIIIMIIIIIIITITITIIIPADQSLGVSDRKSSRAGISVY